MKEQKDNQCKVEFDCKGFKIDGSECFYFVRDGNNCEYAGYTTTGFCCNSNEAQTAAMISELEKKGFKVVKDE